MVDHGSEIGLLLTVLLNAMVFGSAWLFATRRITASRSQALLDAALFGYAIQYAAVGLPGMLGQLRPVMIALVAIIFSVLLIVFAFRSPRPVRDARATSWIFPCAVAVFACAFVLAFVQAQAGLPIVSNDALTYHFPAAAQWLQHHRIDLYQTWFFNPANTFSPLAGSTFIAWLIAPFGNDVLARFVEVPALMCVGLALYRLARELGVGADTASLVAAAAMLCRPVFLQCMMEKDDLFLAFFFIAILVALAADRLTERFGAVRLGIALGLLLATKYTAFLALPVLLLATTTNLASLRRIGIAVVIALVVAGPWYLRNMVQTGNPIFPLSMPFMQNGLFTPAVSEAMGSPTAVMSVLVGGSYGMPVAVTILLGLGWAVALWFGVRSLNDALLRTCLIGPMIGIAIFCWKSPFPEVRFVVPEFLLLFAATGFAIDQFRWRIIPALVLVAVSLGTIFMPYLWPKMLPFPMTAIASAGIAAMVFWFTRLWALQRRVLTILAGAVVILTGLEYVYWPAYCRGYLETLHVDGSAFEQNYPAEEKLWRFINEKTSADATVAYTNLYMTYPFFGPGLNRQLVYAPVNDLHAIKDLPWLGNHLSGEDLVAASTRATMDHPDRSVWFENLKKAGASYLVVGRAGQPDEPPEAKLARADPHDFRLLFIAETGSVYEIEPSLTASSRPP